MQEGAHDVQRYVLFLSFNLKLVENTLRQIYDKTSFEKSKITPVSEENTTD